MSPNDPIFPSYKRPDAGMTLRQVLAAVALQGYIASHTEGCPPPAPETAAQRALEYADALIVELAKPVADRPMVVGAHTE